MSAERQIQRDAVGTVEIVLDSNCIVLSVESSETSQRLVSDVKAGECLHSHIHPDEYDFFLWCAQWVMDQPGRNQTILLRWARSQGRWSRINVTLRHDGGDGTVRVLFQPDEVEHARRAEMQLRRVVEGSAQGVIVRTMT